MNLVIDANVLFSTLIKNGKSAEILLNYHFNLFTPEFVLEEFENHLEEILLKTKRSQEEFENVLNIIKEIVNIIPKEDFEEFIDEALIISPDTNDAIYFALALKLNCSIWSNDKILKSQDKVKIYSTEDLINLIE